jgi:hypothetical protein
MILYSLEIHKCDNYFYSHDTFSCKKVNVIDTINCESIYKENGKIIRKNSSIKYKIIDEKGIEELVNINDGKYFKSLKELLKYFKKEYFKIYSDNYYDYYMDSDTKNLVTCVSNLSNRGLGLSKDHIDLQKELKENK